MTSGKIIKNGYSTQSEIIKGVEKTVSAIKVTLGPAGKCVAIDEMKGPEVTRDGATVAKSISFKNPELNMGARLVKDAATKTEEEVGDGTSNCSVLINEMCKIGQRYLETGHNVNEIKSGMLKAEKWVIDYIKSKSTTIADGDFEKIRLVATISANNDPEVGDLVVKGMESVGMEGVITSDVASGLDTVIDITDGMKIERGWSSPQYVTSPEDGKCVMEDPYILVIGEKLSNMNQLVGILEPLVQTGKPFLIICDDIDEVVNTTFVLNTIRGAVRCCVVKGIDFGDNRKNIMQDIAVMTGGEYISPETGKQVTEMTLEDCGAAERVVVSKDSTIIFNGFGDKDQIKDRVNILKKRLESPDLSEYDKTKFSKRIAGLSGGIAIIKAGGASETEKLNRKATIEDSILASKSAVSEGYVPGGGYIYYRSSIDVQKDKSFWLSLSGDELVGAKIVFNSLPCIMKTIAENSGVSGDVVLKEVKSNLKKSNWGYNAKTRTYGDLVESGVLDSAKVLRIALQNSVSAASMILLIDCTITDDESENNNDEVI